MVNVENVEEVLKSYYLDAINEQLSGEVSPFFNAIEKTSEYVVGKDVYLTVAGGTLSGVAALGETDDLPSPRADRYYSVTLDLKNIYGTIEITDKAIRASAHSAGPFINLLNAETEGLVKGAKANFARMLYGDGNGTLCKVVSKKSDKEIVVDDVKSYMTGLNIVIKGGSKNLETGITGVNVSAGTIEVADSLKDLTLSGGEKIVIKGAEGNEILGLAAIFDDSTLYGYSRTHALMNSYDKTCARSALTESDLTEAIDSLEERSDGKPNMILCSYKTRNKIAALTSATRRIVNSTDIAAGYSSIYVNDVPVYADKFCPNDRIYFVNTDDFVLNQLCDWSWLESDGGRILKQIPGKAAYSATIVKYAQLFCKRPYAQGIIRLT